MTTPHCTGGGARANSLTGAHPLGSAEGRLPPGLEPYGPDPIVFGPREAPRAAPEVIGGGQPEAAHDEQVIQLGS
jgi:hypothetical protein